MAKLANFNKKLVTCTRFLYQKTKTGNQMITFNTLYEILKHSVEKFSKRIAFSMIGGEDVSYQEVG